MHFNQPQVTQTIQITPIFTFSSSFIYLEQLKLQSSNSVYSTSKLYKVLMSGQGHVTSHSFGK